MASLLGPDNGNKVQHDIFSHVMSLVQHKHHIMLTASSMAPLLLLVKGNQN